ncbi:MAG: hypothetical protein ACE5HH_05080 [Candidatus Hydrothermarchaeales archaeon]
MDKNTVIKWFSRILSTAVMMSVFFAGFIGVFSVFFYGGFVKGILVLVYVIVGLVVSRKLWV